MRVLAVADVYEALTAERPYREALSHDQAVIELQTGAGTQFDPRVADALLGYLEDRTPVDYAARHRAAAV